MNKGNAVHRLHIAEDPVPDNTTDLVPVNNKVKTWASENAYTLIFLSAMFFITWLILIFTVTKGLYLQ